MTKDRELSKVFLGQESHWPLFKCARQDQTQPDQQTDFFSERNVKNKATRESINYLGKRRL